MGSKSESGLTAEQERAALMLATGAGVQAVSDAVDVHRSTLWAWRQTAAFEAYYNQLLSDIRRDVRCGLVGLYREALETVRRCLESDDPKVALDAAFRVIERAESLSTGKTDAGKIQRLNDLEDLFL